MGSSSFWSSTRVVMEIFLCSFTCRYLNILEFHVSLHNVFNTYSANGAGGFWYLRLTLESKIQLGILLSFYYMLKL